MTVAGNAARPIECRTKRTDPAGRETGRAGKGRAPVIIAQGLTKTYSGTTVVDDLTFQVQPGVVTGFLGPNGAGKSTTMRMMVGLDRPSAGSVTVAGRQYRDLPAPLREVGAVLESRSIHTGRTAFNHLKVLAATHHIARSRVLDLIEMVGLVDVAAKRVGTFSLGMTQRLGIAAALLGDPATLLLDEPVNGLDPDGIRWIRTLLRSLPAEGRTVFVSSHLMSEMALTADHVVIIGRGRLIADGPIASVLTSAVHGSVLVRSPQAPQLAVALAAGGVHISSPAPDLIEITGLTAAQIGDRALAERIAVHELTPRQASLEDAFMQLTDQSVQFHGSVATGPAAPQVSA